MTSSFQFANSTGIARFYNPKLDEGNQQIITLQKIQLRFFPGSYSWTWNNLYCTNIIPGVTVTQEGNLTRLQN